MITSRLLSQFPELIHGFSDKSDGNMSKLKSLPESEQAKAAHNRKRFLDKLGIKVEQVVLSQQVHGDRIQMVTPDHYGYATTNDTPFMAADCLLTDSPSTFLTVFTADCLPIFIYEPQAKLVGTIHAGWRGLSLNLVTKSIQKIGGLGGEVKNLAVWIGPHIQACHYRLDPESESYQAKINAFGSEQTKTGFLDLTNLAVRQLEETGLQSNQIEISPDCTAEHPDRYFSYHQSRGDLTGIMMSEANHNGVMMGVIGYATLRERRKD